MEKRRCSWCNLKNPLYVEYHDSEWGKPNFDERYSYEMLILETFQAGLSWECVLNKREAFRKAYDFFDLETVCSYDAQKIEELFHNQNIIRNKRKIEASVENSKIFRKIVWEYGSFFEYLRQFTGNRVLYETGRTQNALSDAISEDLRNRGMKFVGSTTVYSYLQAIGWIHSHDKDCFLHREGEK